LTVAFGEMMLELAGIEGGRTRLEEAIGSGAALEKLIDVTIAHGGDPSVIEDTSKLPVAPLEAVITAARDGYVTRCDALTIGIAATLLGAGRTSQEEVIDPGVGITVHAKNGDSVTAGDPLATVHYSDEKQWQAQRDRLASAWLIGDEEPSIRPLILETVTADSTGA
jgi:pyrimidine-nucleoside phosphorylase